MLCLFVTPELLRAEVSRLVCDFSLSSTLAASFGMSFLTPNCPRFFSSKATAVDFSIGSVMMTLHSSATLAVASRVREVIRMEPCSHGGR